MHKPGRPCPGDRDQFQHGITNGAAWYSVSGTYYARYFFFTLSCAVNRARPDCFVLLRAGGMQDWNYLHTNCFELTIEVSCTKFPQENKLESFWKENENALLVFMAQVRVNSTLLQ